jgi:hypothetical protein
MVGLMLIVLLIGVVAAVTMVAATGNLIMLVVVIVCFVVVAVYSSPLIIAAISRGAVRLSPQGIATSGPLLQRLTGWHEIQSVEVLHTRGGRIACLMLNDGARRQLAAPRDMWPRPDPDFDAKMQIISRYWHAYRDNPVTPQPRTR